MAPKKPCWVKEYNGIYRGMPRIDREKWTNNEKHGLLMIGLQKHSHENPEMPTHVERSIGKRGFLQKTMLFALCV